MPQRSELVAEAAELVDLYRQVAVEAPIPEDVVSVGQAIGRALQALDDRWTQETLDRAAVELASARETLTRIRRALDR